MRPSAPGVLGGLAMLALCTSSCTGTDRYSPGTPLGTFQVTGHLVSNTCGAGIGAVDPWVFDVRLNESPGTLYWIQGGPPVSGGLHADGTATLTTGSSTLIHDADPAHHVAYCAITRDDTLQATLPTGEVTSFTGSISYHYDAESGSDCSDQLSTAGGEFQVLPCDVVYGVDGTRTVAPK